MLCVICANAIKLFSKFIIIKIVHSKLHRTSTQVQEHADANKERAVSLCAIPPVNNCLLRNNKTYICSA